MIRVGLNYVCLFEHLDGQVGGKVVRAVVPGSRTIPTSVVFEDGYCLPLLCPCCGRPIETKAGIGTLADFVGLRLVALDHLSKKGDQAECAVYIFETGAGGKRRVGSRGSDEKNKSLRLHLNSARQISRLSSDDLALVNRAAAGRQSNWKKKR